MSIEQAIKALCETMSSRGHERGWQVSYRDDLLFGKVLRADRLSLLGQPEGSAVANIPQPTVQYAMSLGPYTVLTASVDGGPTHDLRDQLRAMLWWAALTREVLTPLERVDLHLVLVAEGDGDPSGWLKWRALVESNDRFCRKFMFIAGRDDDSDERNRFLDQTFLACPWDAVPDLTPRTIDPLTHVALAAEDVLLSEAELALWLRRLGIRTESKQELASDLVEALRKAGDD